MASTGTGVPTPIDLGALIEHDLGRLATFENVLWAEEEPSEPLIAEPVVAYLHRPRPDTKRWAWLVEAPDGSIAGLAVLRGSTNDNVHVGTAQVRVVPVARRRGIGRSLLAACAEAAHADGRRVLHGFTADRVPSGEPFARAMGAAPGLVVRRSELDLSSLDRNRLRSWLAVPDRTSERYELVTVVGRYPVDQYDAIAEVEQVMNTAPHDDLDIEDEVRDGAWVASREALYDPAIEQRWTIFAKDRASGRFVGFTQAFFYDDWPGMVAQGNTGVHPDHRGFGLGLWLKAAMLERILADKPDSRRMRTNNAFSNRHMLAINDELGYAITATSTAWQAAIDDVIVRAGRPT